MRDLERATGVDFGLAWSDSNDYQLSCIFIGGSQQSGKMSFNVC